MFTQRAQIASLFLFFFASNVLADHGLPTPHRNLGLSVPATSSTGNYTVTWNSGTDYYFDEKVGQGNWTNLYYGSAGTYSFTGKPDGTYSYRVRWHLCLFDCVWYYTYSQSILVPGAPQTPSAITGPSADTDGDYVLAWGASTGADTYELERQDPGQQWTPIQYSVGTSYTEIELGSGTYQYRVRACKSGACSDWTANKQVIVSLEDGIATAPSIETSNLTVGASKYGVNVAGNGDARISIPLRLIPGVAGFRPTLALVYESGRAVFRAERSLPEDTIGYGWRLVGLSQIRRCVVGQSNSNSIDLDTSDSICLDGIPLVLKSGSPWTPGAEYRTAIESYKKIVVKGAIGSLWFEVTLPDGTVLEYGRRSGSRVDQGGVDFQWSLSKATSVDNNVIDYYYYRDTSKGINYPTSIEYDGAKIELRYSTRTDTSAVNIGADDQTQTVFLHTIAIKMNANLVREYRLFGQTIGGNLRLENIQHCGYDENGQNPECLTADDVNWTTPSPSHSNIEILLEEFVDSLGASTKFEYWTLDSQSSGQNDGLFATSDLIWGNGTPPADTQAVSGAGVFRHVVKKLRRDNGKGGYNDTSYLYQGTGLESTKNWGFLGFYTRRVKEELSDVSLPDPHTYVQYRQDYPFFGAVARVYAYDDEYGSHSEMLSRYFADYASDVSGTAVPPYLARSVSFVYEDNTELGGTQVVEMPTLSSGFVSQVVTNADTANSITEGATPSGWGQIPSTVLSDHLLTVEATEKLTNRTTNGDWLVGFVNESTTKSWGWSGGNLDTQSLIEQKSTFNPEDDSVRAEKVTRFPGDTNLELITDVSYDSRGRTRSVTVSGASVASRTTAWGNLGGYSEGRYPLNVENALGHNTTISGIDLRFGKRSASSDPNSLDTFSGYDPFGRVVSATNSDGVVTTTTYTWDSSVMVNNVTSKYKVTTDSSITPLQRTYMDKLGRVLRTEYESLDGTMSRTDVWYDADGRVEKSSLPYLTGNPPYYATSTYDVQGRVTNITAADGGSTATSFSKIGNHLLVTTTETVKDSTGATVRTPVKRSEFNILGQLVKTTDAYATSLETETTFSYDSIGNATTVQVNGGSGLLTSRTMKYDAAGNQTEVDGPDFDKVTTTYTALGEPKTVTDGKSQVTTFAFDLLGRRTSRTSPDVTATWVWDTATHGKGELQSRNTNDGFSETYQYNTDGKLSSITTSIIRIGQSVPNDYTTSYGFDANGRVNSITYDYIYTVTREYNARGYLSKLKNGATVLHEWTDTNAFGQATTETYGNGATTTRSFFPESGRLSSVETLVGAQQIQDLQYKWQTDGVLERRKALPNAGVLTTREEVFDYDVLGRIDLGETFINGSNTRDLDYLFDNLGNLKSKTSTVTGDLDAANYVYGENSDGPHAVTSVDLDGVSHDLDYDLNGALENIDDLNGATPDTYIKYNSSNQPTAIVVGTSLLDSNPEAKDEFRYDPDGQRYTRKSRWTDGIVTKEEWVDYVGTAEFMEHSNGGNVHTSAKIFVSDNVRVIESSRANDEYSSSGSYPFNLSNLKASTVEYVHRDHLGSLESVTDASGYRKIQVGFEPFGMHKANSWGSNISNSAMESLFAAELEFFPLEPGLAPILRTHQVPFSRGYTGHEHLQNTGFIHMNGRVFDPRTARFLSPDPIVQTPSLSQSWNRFAYTSGDPLSATDPSGYKQSDERVDEIMVRGRAIRVLGGGTMFGSFVPFEYKNFRIANSSDQGSDDDGAYIDEVTVTGQRWYGRSYIYASMVESIYISSFGAVTFSSPYIPIPSLPLAGTWDRSFSDCSRSANSGELGETQNSRVVGRLNEIDFSLWEQEGLVGGTGNSLRFSGTRTALFSTSSNAGPLPTHQWYFTVTAIPLGANGQPQASVAGPEWYEPVRVNTMTGGAAVNWVVAATGSYSEYGYDWIVRIPNQPSTHDNNSGLVILAFSCTSVR